MRDGPAATTTPTMQLQQHQQPIITYHLNGVCVYVVRRIPFQMNVQHRNRQNDLLPKELECILSISIPTEKKKMKWNWTGQMDSVLFSIFLFFSISAKSFIHSHLAHSSRHLLIGDPVYARVTRWIFKECDDDDLYLEMNFLNVCNEIREKSQSQYTTSAHKLDFSNIIFLVRFQYFSWWNFDKNTNLSLSLAMRAFLFSLLSLSNQLEWKRINLLLYFAAHIQTPKRVEEDKLTDIWDWI